jgi:hypothetical protein
VSSRDSAGQPRHRSTWCSKPVHEDADGAGGNLGSIRSRHSGEEGPGALAGRALTGRRLEASIRNHWPQARRITPSRPADILNAMDSRASDKIPGARVRFKRDVPAQSSSDARPREWLALADGAVQEAKTEGPALTLIGEPLPYQPGRAERRSGVPAEVITSDRVPNSCTCSWAYSQGKLTLKHYNAACPEHLAILGR